MKHFVIERFRFTQLPLVGWYRLRGYTVSYLHPEGGESIWLDRLESGGLIRRLTLADPLYKESNPASDAAFDATPAIYAQTVAPRPIVKWLASLLPDPGVDLAYQKACSAVRYRVEFVRLLGERIHASLPAAEEIVFVPARPVAHLKAGPGWAVAWWAIVSAAFRDGVERIMAPVLLVAAAVRGPWRRRRFVPPSTYAFAIVAPEREFANEVRTVGFLLDGGAIRVDNSVFIPLVRLQPAHLRFVASKGLRVIAPDQALSLRARVALVRAVWQILRHLREPGWLLLTTALVLREYWRWSALLEQAAPKHFVSYADFGLKHYGRNIALRRAGVTTWYYTDATNTSDAFYTKHDGTPHRHQYWGYLYYDCFVSWGPRYTRYIQLHPQGPRRYMDVGCLWSEHVVLIREGALPSTIPSLLRRAGWHEGLRVIAVFDSTYDNEALTTYADGQAFAEGIARLLAARPDIFIVFKEKKPRTYHATHGSRGGLEQAYADLDAHRRCLMVGHRASGSEVIAFSDLTIAFPFSSSAIEAIGARRRGLYYDPRDKYPRSFFREIPRLVVTTWQDLADRVDELLAMRDADYEAYLERYVKGDIDPYLDARALTRFRSLLGSSGGCSQAEVPGSGQPWVTAWSRDISTA